MFNCKELKHCFLKLAACFLKEYCGCRNFYKDGEDLERNLDSS